MFEQRAANRTQAPVVHRRCEDPGPGNAEVVIYKRNAIP
jgi:hypothetical protein